MAGDVFISHASEDAGVTAQVCALLEGRGLRCWMAPRDVPGGAVWDEAILDAIEGSRVFLLILSRKANQSQFVKNEVNRAFSQNKPIVTFRLEEVAPGRSLELYLARHHWTDAFPPPLPPHIERLASSIAAHLAAGAGTPQQATAPAVVASRAETNKIAHVSRARPWWQGKAALAIAASIVLLLLAGAGWLYRSHASAGGAAIDSVAVLPFVNVSGDPNSEYLSDGITESLIDSLSQLPHLRVMSRDSAFMFKGKDTDARIVGSQLGVRAVFKGRVMQRGEGLEISAELVDARDDSHIWGQQYNRKAADIFALQGDLAKEMTSALRMRLTGADAQRMTKSYTANPEAYQLYLQGRYWWFKRTEEGENKAVGYFQQAIEKDPNYALAYSGLADSYNGLAGLALAPPAETIPKAKEAALKALEIDGALGEAHSSLAYTKMYEWDWAGSEEEFHRAIELNPGYALSHDRYGFLLVHVGRMDEAIAEFKRALEMDPLSTVFNRDLGDALIYDRQYDQAIDQLRKTTELDVNYPQPWGDLCSAYQEKSLYDDALRACEKRLALTPNSIVALEQLGVAYARAGRSGEAEKLLDQLNSLSARKYVREELRARMYVALGEKEKAFEWLEKGLEARSLGSGFGGLKLEPIFDPLRSDPRFADLLRRMNLQP